ncbi:hypothetical protein ACA29_01825 [Lederbergia galactosidilytica]|uniref:Uncharacterized protein n=1 Tax=Lederbergia galactosidilytica TaxID=217031 RepID=A0A0Q9YJP7_9BACI|nr:hypothetical protein ACA29_01825 [Lederbergia galactosidilytica]
MSELGGVELHYVIILPSLFISTIGSVLRIFGWGLSEYYILILAIPVITWINLLILQFAKKEK